MTKYDQRNETVCEWSISNQTPEQVLGIKCSLAFLLSLAQITPEIKKSHENRKSWVQKKL